MLNELFSDYFAQKDNLLTRIDARLKMIFVLAAIITTLYSRTPYLPIVVTLLSAIALIGIRIPIKIILFRISCPLCIAAVVLAIQVFSYGDTPLFKCSLFGFPLVGYKEGLSHGLLITSKVAGCVSLVTFLSMTTPVNILLRAALWFKVSKTWIEIAMVTYRYIFVLMEDMITIRDAQRVRLGYSNLSRSFKSLSELAGSVFIRAYDQSIATSQAMLLRGYLNEGKICFHGGFSVSSGSSLGRKLTDGLFGIIFLAILSLLVALNHFWG